MLTEKNIENRKLGIGASEAGIVMGLSKFMSPYELWRIKTGLDQPKNLDDVPQVHWGHIHEEAIAQEYARVTNCKVRKMSNTIFHKEYPFMLCHLDRKIEGQPKVLECKYAMYNRDDWGPNGSDIVPLSYIVQVQYQMAVTGYIEADLAVLISGWDFRIYHFKRDEELIAKILSEVKKFWQCVTDNVRADLRDRDDVAIAFPENNGSFKEADTTICKTVESLKKIKQEIKNYEDEKKALENKLALFLEDADGVKVASQVLATWKANSRGSRVLRIVE